MSGVICTCAQYDAREALALWNKRARPIIERLLYHGHTVSSDNMAVTAGLVILLEQMAPQCFAPEHAHRSHHLPGCPIKGRRSHSRLSVARRAPTEEDLARFNEKIEAFLKQRA